MKTIRTTSPAASIVLAVALGVTLVAAVTAWRAVRPSEPVHEERIEAQEPVPVEPPAPRTYWVRIRANAVNGVRVDGQPMQLTQKGFLEVNGVVGSRHVVSVTTPTREHSFEVMIGNDGATPVEIAIAPEPGAPASPKPPARGNGASGKGTAAGGPEADDKLTNFPAAPQRL